MVVITHALETNAVRIVVLWVTQGYAHVRINRPTSRALRSTEISCDLTSNPPKYKQILKIAPNQLNFSKDKHFIHNFIRDLPHEDEEMR
jgi:hypothetical protein